MNLGRYRRPRAAHAPPVPRVALGLRRRHRPPRHRTRRDRAPRHGSRPHGARRGGAGREGRFVKADHRNPVLRRCRHCGRPFVVNPRLGKRHRFCSRAACAQASKRAAQTKWLGKWRKEHDGKGYFSGTEHGDSVRDWRMRHPQYWKTTNGRFRGGGRRVAAAPTGAGGRRWHG